MPSSQPPPDYYPDAWAIRIKYCGDTWNHFDKPMEDCPQCSLDQVLLAKFNERMAREISKRASPHRPVQDI